MAITPLNRKCVPNPNRERDDIANEKLKAKMIGPGLKRRIPPMFTMANHDVATRPLMESTSTIMGQDQQERDHVTDPHPETDNPSNTNNKDHVPNPHPLDADNPNAVNHTTQTTTTHPPNTPKNSTVPYPNASCAIPSSIPRGMPTNERPSNDG
jgi:hypothetical protein